VVGRVRSQQALSIDTFLTCANGRQISIAWLNPRSAIRDECKGIGTILSKDSLAQACAISCPNHAASADQAIKVGWVALAAAADFTLRARQRTTGAGWLRQTRQLASAVGAQQGAGRRCPAEQAILWQHHVEQALPGVVLGWGAPEHFS
jgi:hypothetical protein